MKLKDYALKTLCSSLIVIMAATAVAQENANQLDAAVGTNTAKIEPAPALDKPFTLNMGLEMSEKVTKDEIAPKENSVSLVIEPIFKLSSLLTASAKIAINQDNYGQHETTASDGTVSMAITGYQISRDFITLHSVGTIIPVSDKSVKTDRLKGSISMSNGIGYTGDYFNLSYKIGVVRFFHEYTQNAEGSPNIQYRLSQVVDLKVPFTEKFALSTSMAYRIGRTYNDFERYGFIYDGDLIYDFTDKFGANLGITTDGSAVKANGVDTNISAFNENTSVYRVGLSYVY